MVVQWTLRTNHSPAIQNNALDMIPQINAHTEQGLEVRTSFRESDLYQSLEFPSQIAIHARKFYFQLEKTSLKFKIIFRGPSKPNPPKK